MLDFSIYLFYRAGTAIAGALSLRALSALGNLLGLGGWLLLGRYRRLARRNLAIAFAGEKSPRELRRLVRRHFRRLGANLLGSAHIGSISFEQLQTRVATENIEAVHRELRAGKPVVLLLSHLSSWELFAQLIPRFADYASIGTIYQTLGNRHIDRDMQRRRAGAGAQLFDRADGFHKPIELLRSGGLIGILGDQHAGDHGVWTPFFGRLASTSPLPGLLAKRTGAAVIAAAIYTIEPGRWRMVFTDRIDVPGDPVNAITAKANTAIEQQIRQAPEDWFWVHDRWKTPSPSFLLAKYKRGVYVPPEISPKHLKPFRILIRAPNWLGDNVISIPGVRAIKAGRPDAHITIMTPANIAAAWKLVPEVDEVISLTNHSTFTAVKLIRRQQRFDAAILFPRSLRSALQVWMAGVPRRVGYSGHYRRWLLNQVIADRSPCGPIQHQVLHYLHLAREIGSPAPPPENRVADTRSVPPGHRVKVGLCPGAEYGPAKRWLPERFAEAATLVAAQHPVQWTLFGTANDAAAGDSIAAELGSTCTNRIGLTTLEELIAELRECAVLLTNDTGTMHLATLIGVPVLAIFGSTEPRLTGPLGRSDRVIRHHVECSPCFLRECPIDFRCMKAVSAEEVSATILAMLNK